MNEAKSLVNMAVSTMFSAMIIGGALVLVGLGYTMWSYFSRQDAANQRMKDYVNYVAYDDTTIRGQEVISLFQYAKQEGLFICVFSNNNQPSGTDDIDSVVPGTSEGNLHFYVPPTCPWLTLHEQAGSIPTAHDNSNVEAALSTVKSYIQSNSDPLTAARCTCCFNHLDTYEKLVQAFTNNYGGASTWSHLGNPDGSKNYAAFKANLVYDTDTSTDVIGITLIRQTVDTTVFD